MLTKKIILLICFSLFYHFIFSQDLGNIGKSKPFQISGNISAATSFYNFSSSDTTAIERGIPFSYTFSGNLNTSIYGISLPLSFTYSNNEKSYRQPFNQFGLSPHYKWAKLYLGYNSISFSPYTLSGYTFMGGGIDLMPSHLRFSAMYGRFNRAISQTDAEKNVSPAFMRKGMAFKIGYGGVKEKAKNYFDIIVLKAKDVASSLTDTVAGSAISPAENFVTGFSTRYSKGKIFIEGDGAYSLYTSNINSTEMTTHDDVMKMVKGFITENNSTQYYTAYSGALGFKDKHFGAKAQYKRVAPGFKSMGTYYLNNDFENYTLSANTNLFKQKLMLDGSFGMQKDNLRNTKNATSLRKIGSANLTFNPSQKFGMTAMYSNYSTDQQRGKIPVVDTSRLYQTTQNIMIMPHYSIVDTNMVHMFMFSFNNMWLNDKNPSTANITQIRTQNFLLSYSRSYIKSGLGVTLGLNYTILDISIGKSENYGLTWGLSKTFLNDKLSTSFSNVINLTHDPDGHGTLVNLNLTASYVINNHHSLGASLYYNNNSSKYQYTPSFNEFRGDFNYTYRF
jgi:hypothetical protein